MAGPYPQDPDPTPGQPGYSEPYPSQPFPESPPPGQPYPPPGQGYQPAAASVYPGMLPPPVPYPKHRRWLLAGGLALIVAIIAAATVAVIYGVRSESGAAAGGELSSGSVKVAIQNYLDALAKGDTDTVARNTLCGMYDAVRDRRSDQALAKLSSDAFRKQFSKAQVTTIDKLVLWSPNQAQVLFSMRVAPAARSYSSQGDEVQAIAQLLSQDNRILVCSYLLRAATQF